MSMKYIAHGWNVTGDTKVSLYKDKAPGINPGYPVTQNRQTEHKLQMGPLAFFTHHGFSFMLVGRMRQGGCNQELHH